ncbi:MFS general substrate transporter [Glarea lozoyensis ATCC 20868]|uniref:MFS general substrate transporter n=1 Tax=Glarea lozoyensis (strain ATCC 20868 / MF5171) TaxID=1116229 RepID=S3D0D8_GLAL2|nr:MFS general substrate transporter [Glarea lozoyensis ATCC 20868]EPE30634.1 MFS general substrate transporter [Glarea lozoyensis ATCC 20868]
MDYSRGTSHSVERNRPDAEQKPIPTQLPARETPIAHNNVVQNLIRDTIEAANPPLRHLASHSSLGSVKSNQTQKSSKSHGSDLRSNRGPRAFIPLATNFESQRAEKPGFQLTRNTKAWEPIHSPRASSVPINPRNSWTAKSDWGESAGTSSESRLGTRTIVTGGAEEHKGNTNLLAAEIPEAVGLEGNDSANATRQRGGAEIEPEYPGTFGLIYLIFGIALSVFLISLDRTIITTAIPLITNEFDSTADVGWYGSSYLLTASAFQPLYGRIYMLFGIKWSYLLALFIFELGNLISAVSTSSVVLIVGRAIAGLGSAGILTGSFVVVSHAVPLKQRPVLTALVGLMFGVGATVGPLLGGVFTDLVTWRWCFYFNLPVGGATALAMIFFFHPTARHALLDKSFFYRVMELDLAGNVILLGACVMLFTALQLTEDRVPWSSARVIGLLAGSGMTFITFIGWQWWKADGALMPPRILKQRSVAASCAAAFFIYSAILIHTYYLPIWFQAVKNDSAIHSGVNMIPYVAANAVFSLLAGIFVSKNGYFTIPAVLGCAIGTVGCGLLSTINEETSSAKWIGFEILASAGIGMAIQQGFTAIQIVLPLEEVAIGTAAVVAFQSLGGAIFVSVGNTILQNSLFDANLPGVDIERVLSAGAAHFRDVAPTEQIPELVRIYDSALRKVFTAAIPMAGLAMVACLFLEFRNVKDKTKSEDEENNRDKFQRSEIEKQILKAHRESIASKQSVI